jgi:hypothetical protein
MPKVWAQGDVVLIEESLPDDAAEVPGHDGVLAYGEATGHSHRIAPNQARFFRSEKGLYFHALNDIPGIIHEDHPGGGTIPQGTVVRYYVQREADWLLEANRRVAD